MCLLAYSGLGRNLLRPPKSPTVQDLPGSLEGLSSNSTSGYIMVRSDSFGHPLLIRPLEHEIGSQVPLRASKLPVPQLPDQKRLGERQSNFFAKTRAIPLRFHQE
jgi:hypothetical protein